jgi:NADH-quinone oxidoreductase subunit A
MIPASPALLLSLPSLLAQSDAAGGDPRVAWAPVVLLILIALGFGVGNVVLSTWIGPKRTGPGKEATYESGMVPVGDTRKRFNVRFYVVAMIFLVIDVDIVFMYPWATIFPGASRSGARVAGGYEIGGLLLVEMFVFVALLLVAYLYAWGKGVFRWD